MELVQMLQHSNGNNIANTALAPRRKRSRDEDDQLTMIHRTAPQILSSSDNCQYPASRRTSGSGSAADIFSYIIQRNNMDIDAVLYQHSERLMAQLKQVGRRSLVAAVAAAERQATKGLREKEAELRKARQMNLLLQERVNQLIKEKHRWMEAAMQSEKILIAMRNNNFAASVEPEVGGGADDAESCCFDGESKVKQIDNNGMKKRCSACMEKEVSVLLLPCRHLCLCRGCEPKLSCCPVCSAAKNATLNVYLC